MLDTNGDAHPHVRSCAKNPTENEYFAPADVFNRLRAEEKKINIISFLRTIEDFTVRKGVLLYVSKALKDIGVSISSDEIK